MAIDPLTGLEQTNPTATAPVSVMNSTQNVADPNQTIADQQGVSSSPLSATNPFAPTPSYVDAAKSTVAGQLDSLLSSNNPYIKLAETKAQEQSAGRGLLNTTLAAQAGRQAAIQSALPVATQDASTYAQQSLENQRAQNLFGLTGYQGQIGSDLSAQQAQQASGLSAQQAQQASGLSTQQAQQQEALTTLQSELLASNQAIQNDFTERLQNLKYDQQSATELSNIVGTQTNNLMNGIFALLRDPTVTMSKETLDWATDFMYASWESAADIYGLDIEVV